MSLSNVLVGGFFSFKIKFGIDFAISHQMKHIFANASWDGTFPSGHSDARLFQPLVFFYDVLRLNCRCSQLDPSWAL